MTKTNLVFLLGRGPFMVIIGIRGGSGGKMEFYCFEEYVTFCLCSSPCRVCRSYSSSAYRRHIDDINSVNSKVWNYGAIGSEISIHKINITLWISREINDIITNGLSLKMFIWQVTPFYHQTGGVWSICDYGVRASGWNWKINNCF